MRAARMKPKPKKKKPVGVKNKEDIFIHDLHQFSPNEVTAFRSKLLDWYSQNKRDLPWRNLPVGGNSMQKAYAVLVSEVMLQQTQVVTVKQYYKNWMIRWPTLQDLAGSTLEEVNEMWAGLGYYARGKRLQEVAKKVVGELDGMLPQSALQLQEQLPGVGQYTAGAVASIAFGERVPAVDGNVIRVLTRLRLIGGDSTSQVVKKSIWNIAESIVDTKNPGDFNEAMMELGAVVCTPKSPKCSSCPVRDMCLAQKLTAKDKNLSVPDIETVPACHLCFPYEEKWIPSLGVMNFPRKSKKPPSRKQETVVCILYRKKRRELSDEYLILKRPSKGLLGNLWEFPSFILDPLQCDKLNVLHENLKTHHGIDEVTHMKSNEYVGKVVHIFSHIDQVYEVFAIRLDHKCVPHTSKNYQSQQWVSKEQFLTSAVSTGMKKIFKKFGSKD